MSKKRAPDGFDRARAELRAATSGLSEIEFDAFVDQVVETVRADRKRYVLRGPDGLTITHNPDCTITLDFTGTRR